MEMLNKVSNWAKQLTEVGVSLIAFGIVLEILFKGAVIPFWPNVSVHLITLVIIGETLLDLIITTLVGTITECMDMEITMDIIIGTTALGVTMDTM